MVFRRGTAGPFYWIESNAGYPLNVWPQLEAEIQAEQPDVSFGREQKVGFRRLLK
jgi:hypothetical protein